MAIYGSEGHTDIRKELLGRSELDIKSDKEVVKFVGEIDKVLKACSGIAKKVFGYHKAKYNDKNVAKKILQSQKERKICRAKKIIILLKRKICWI